MKNKKNTYRALLAAGVVCAAVIGAVPRAELSAEEETSRVEQETADGMVVRGKELVFPPMGEYEISDMGAVVAPPESLLERMENKEVAMLMDGAAALDGSGVQYSFLSWSTMTEEQGNAEIDLTGDDYEEWEQSLGRIGTVGVYQTELAERLDELTGCNEHQKIGESADGAYKYYLSINTEADEELKEEVLQIHTTIRGIEGSEVSAEPSGDTAATERDGKSLGEFEMQDINGQIWTQEMFQDYDLTMVNIFTTWCSPCVAEIPDLEELHRTMADQGVNIVGVVMDILDENGEINPEGLEKAKLLAKQTGAEYPFLIPDATYMNGRLTGIEAFPETFFVDKNGSITGETYSGSRGLEDWKEVVEKELAKVKENAE